MNTIDYLNEAKRKLGIKTDYELMKKTGISEQALSHYRKGKRIMDDYTAAKIAEVLDIPAIQVIAEANAEREKTQEKRDFWRKIASGSRGTLAAMLLIISGVWIAEDVSATIQNIHYAQWFGLVCMAFLFWSISQWRGGN